MASIQFWGVTNVMAAFDGRKVEAWSLWQGRDYLFKGIGDADLMAVLETLKNSFNDPIYTLKVYEGVKDPLSIKNTTAHDGCFNFKLNQPADNNGMGNMGGGNVYLLQKRIEELENKIFENNNENDKEEEPETIGSVILNVLKNPEQTMQWVTMIKSIFSPNINYQNNPRQLIGTLENKEDELARLGAAIDRLEKTDPDLVIHLEKLADMAEKSPAQFKFLLSTLEKM